MANSKVFRKLNSQEINESWSPMIDQYGIKDAYKKQWIAEYCHYHAMFDNSGALFESTPGLNFQLPNSINGMGAPLAPTRTANGSGDKFPTLLPVAMQVAAKTIAFDLVPVIPMDSPVGFLPYLDYVYAGGKLNSTSEPFLIKIAGIDVDTTLTGSPAADFGDLSAGQTVTVTADGSPSTVLATLKVVGKSRVDGLIIFRVISVDDSLTINGVITTANELNLTYNSNTYSYDLGASNTASLVSALENHISGFSAAGDLDDQDWNGNFYPASASSYTVGGMTRETAEEATYRQMNLKMFTKWVEAKGDQVSISATVEQIQDLNRVWNYDVISMLENVGVNEISQSISKKIVMELFKLGGTHATQLVKAEGANLATLDLTAITSSYENQSTFQRRLISRVMQVAQLIYHRGRFGAGEYVVTNGRLAAAMMDNQGYTFNAAPMDMPKGAGQLYPMGKVYGVTIYVDPNLNWNDQRVLVGRKGADDEPGLKFLPYIMAESLQTISEATMSPKIAIKSRYAITDAGFHPQNQYFVFKVVDGGNLI